MCRADFSGISRLGDGFVIGSFDFEFTFLRSFDWWKIAVWKVRAVFGAVTGEPCGNVWVKATGSLGPLV